MPGGVRGHGTTEICFYANLGLGDFSTSEIELRGSSPHPPRLYRASLSFSRSSSTQALTRLSVYTEAELLLCKFDGEEFLAEMSMFGPPKVRENSRQALFIIVVDIFD